MNEINKIKGLVIDSFMFKKSKLMLIVKTTTGEKINIYVEDFEPYFYIINSDDNIINLIDILKNFTPKSKIKINNIKRFLYTDNEIDFIKIKFGSKGDLMELKNELKKRSIEIFNYDIYKQDQVEYQFSHENNIDFSKILEFRNLKYDNCKNRYFIKKDNIISLSEDIFKNNFKLLKLKVLTFDIETVSDNPSKFPDADLENDYISCISYAYEIEKLSDKKNIKWNIIYVYSEDIDIDKDLYEINFIKRFETEKDMIIFFKNELLTYDVVQDFNGLEFDLPYLIKRLEKYDVNLIEDYPCFIQYFNKKVKLNGIIHYDLLKAMKARDADKNKFNSLKYLSMKYLRVPIINVNNNIITTKKFEIYKNMSCIINKDELDDIITQNNYLKIIDFHEEDGENNEKLLKLKIEGEIKLFENTINYISLIKDEMDKYTMHTAFKRNNKEDIKKILLYCVNDTRLTKMIINKNQLMLSYIMKNLIRKVLLRDSVNEGNSFLNQVSIIKDLLQRNFVIKSKTNNDDELSSKYEGATVFSLKPGLYKNIVVFDFSSLYPSIIRAFNICITTMLTEDKIKDYNINDLHKVNIGDENIYFIKNKVGIIPELCKNLVNLRKEIKKQMKETNDPLIKNLCSIKEKNVKVSANSVYGTLGDQSSVLYLKQIAAAVTAIARDYIEQTKNYVENYLKYPGYKIIAGDTDSIFIDGKDRNITLEKQLEELTEILDQFNLTLPYPMKLEKEKLYKIVLLMKKKKRMGIKTESNDKNGNPIWQYEQKGSYIIKRDIPLIIKQVESDFFNMIEKSYDNLENLEDNIIKYIDEYLNNMINKPKGDFEIVKSLKEIDDYKNVNSIGHACLALKLKESGKLENINSGDKISYVFVKELRYIKNTKDFNMLKDRILPINVMDENNFKIDYLEYIYNIYEMIYNNFECMFNQNTKFWNKLSNIIAKYYSIYDKL